MRAAVVPAIHGKWEVKDVPTPHPATNQVLIKIHASGLCYYDVHITEGHLPTSARTIGHEPAGEIVELGSGVASRKIGDRVGVPWLQASCRRCEWCQRGKPMFCLQQIGTGINTPGSHAEYMVAYADATTLIPNGISYEQAAPVFCAGYTVWSGLRFADPKPHEKIAVLGIGGLGHLAIQFSKAAGFYTIGITHSQDKEELARKLGDDIVVSNGDALKRAGGADVILVTSNSYKPAKLQVLPVDLEILPMILKFGSRLNSDLAHIIHPDMLLHLDKLKVVSFSYFLINNGLSCLSILM
ncbi:MAG: alcohol dehydrogenase catalytic domain-containing protein [Thermoproteota archaeon]|nr:alcohol dehydrogenase catalytic domain-containing protein [Thermoproteota archaeon]